MKVEDYSEFILSHEEIKALIEFRNIADKIFADEHDFGNYGVEIIIRQDLINMIVKRPVLYNFPIFGLYWYRVKLGLFTNCFKQQPELIKVFEHEIKKGTKECFEYDENDIKRFCLYIRRVKITELSLSDADILRLHKNCIYSLSDLLYFLEIDYNDYYTIGVSNTNDNIEKLTSLMFISQDCAKRIVSKTNEYVQKIREYGYLFYDNAEIEENTVKSSDNSFDCLPAFDILNMTPEDMDLSVRSFNCLKRAGINTVQDLLKYSENDVIEVLYEIQATGKIPNVESYYKSIRNLGKKSLDEISGKLKDLMNGIGSIGFSGGLQSLNNDNLLYGKMAYYSYMPNTTIPLPNDACCNCLREIEIKSFADLFNYCDLTLPYAPKKQIVTLFKTYVIPRIKDIKGITNECVQLLFEKTCDLSWIFKFEPNNSYIISCDDPIQYSSVFLNIVLDTMWNIEYQFSPFLFRTHLSEKSQFILMDRGYRFLHELFAMGDSFSECEEYRNKEDGEIKNNTYRYITDDVETEINDFIKSLVKGKEVLSEHIEQFINDNIGCYFDNVISTNADYIEVFEKAIGNCIDMSTKENMSIIKDIWNYKTLMLFQTLRYIDNNEENIKYYKTRFDELNIVKNQKGE